MQTLQLPPHVEKASWIGPEDKKALREGFASLSPSAQQHFLDHCFDKVRGGYFDVLAHPYFRSLLLQESNDVNAEPTGLNAP